MKYLMITVIIIIVSFFAYLIVGNVAYSHYYENGNYSSNRTKTFTPATAKENYDLGIRVANKNLPMRLDEHTVFISMEGDYHKKEITYNYTVSDPMIVIHNYDPEIFKSALMDAICIGTPDVAKAGHAIMKTKNIIHNYYNNGKLVITFSGNCALPTI